MKTKFQIYLPSVILYISVSILGLSSLYTKSQNTVTANQIPVTGHYPGGHTGVKGGNSPAEGIAVFNFNRFLNVGDIKDANGNTVANTNNHVFGEILGAVWNTAYKYHGLSFGGLVAFPFDQISNNNNGTTTKGNLGFNDMIIAPLGVFARSKRFDYNFTCGLWIPTGNYDPGSINSHGTGFWSIMYSFGGVFYPDSNRNSFSFSIVSRFEQNFKQENTGITPGWCNTTDWGIGSPLIPLDKKRHHIIYFGLSGFIQGALTEEEGNPYVSTTLYRLFGTGGEFYYIFRPAKLQLRIRQQWQHNGVNTTQGSTLWVSLTYKLLEK